MAVRLRLARTGKKKQPHYRIVAADARVPRDGRFLEILGWYDPRSEPSSFQVDLDGVRKWLDRGATPSERVAKLLALAESPAAARVSTPPKGATAPQVRQPADEAPEGEGPASEDVVAESAVEETALAAEDDAEAPAEAASAEPASVGVADVEASVGPEASLDAADEDARAEDAPVEEAE